MLQLMKMLWKSKRVLKAIVGARRFMSLHANIAKVIKRLPACWALLFIAIDPSFQDQGLGSSLVQPVLEWSDQDGVPCTIFTLNERTINFFMKLGFHIIERIDVASMNVSVWFLQRDSKTLPSS